ncbi:MAG: hypothetical protein E7487_03340 [Ruminococcaceae bacterium]|nr:hypothetical protein [Oscillospiraceae bacterium]
MKSFAIFCISLLCLLFLNACRVVTTPAVEDSAAAENSSAALEITITAGDQQATLSPEDAEKILKILENGRWINDLFKCESDYRIDIAGRTLTYHSDCGSFNDSHNKICLATDDATQKEINDILSHYIQP